MFLPPVMVRFPDALITLAGLCFFCLSQTHFACNFALHDGKFIRLGILFYLKLAK